MFTLSDSIIAAAIAAIVSWLGLVISKETKVSEFRQNWIDGLREDIATLLGETTQYHAFVLGLAPQPSVIKINELMARIRLRLNLKEADHQKLFDEIVKCQTMVLNKNSQPDVGKQIDQISYVAAEVLKKEWNVVKRGEFVYKWTFRGLLLLIAYALASYFLNRHFGIKH